MAMAPTLTTTPTGEMFSFDNCQGFKLRETAVTEATITATPMEAPITTAGMGTRPIRLQVGVVVIMEGTEGTEGMEGRSESEYEQKTIIVLGR